MNTLTLFELLLIAIGVSMDAFAVAICKGLSFKKNSIINALIVAAYFGIFQGTMPLIGYLLGVGFQDTISSIDHWIAFVLLGVIGINMIKESNEPDTCECGCDDNSTCGCDSTVNSLAFKTMIVLAVATSIDALAVGVTFAFLKVDIIPAVILIGATTFIFSFFGVRVGNKFGTKYKTKAEIFGGLVLIFMAFNILFDHL